MTTNYSSKKLGGYILALFLILGFTTIASTSVQAQWRDRDRDRDDRYERDRDYRRHRDYDRDRDYQRDRDYRDYRYGRNNGYDVARQQGYSYGMNVGASDAQRGQNYDPQRSRYWRNATEGYNSYYGNKGQYKQVFRDAFEQGYRDGWQRYGGYNRGRNSGRYGRIWPW